MHVVIQVQLSRMIILGFILDPKNSRDNSWNKMSVVHSGAYRVRRTLDSISSWCNTKQAIVTIRSMSSDMHLSFRLLPTNVQMPSAIGFTESMIPPLTTSK